MIRLENITKKYKKNKKENTVLNDISYTFDDTGLYFITGKSGAGKSTILSIISGIDLKYQGDVVVDGKEMKKFSSKELNYYRSSYLGYVFQDYNLISELTVYDNIKLGLDVTSNKDESIIDDTLDKLDILKLKDRNISELSGGEKQRVAIARCLVKNPRVIICDEPTAALDIDNARNILSILKDTSKDRLVIVVTHNAGLVEEFAGENISLDSHVQDNGKKSCDNHFEAKKYNGLSSKLIYRLGIRNIFKKKISLVFSLLCIVLSFVLLSLSISGLAYKDTKAWYTQMAKENMYYAVNNYDNNSNHITVSDKKWDEIKKKYPGKTIPMYMIDDISTNESKIVESYYLNERENYIQYSFENAYHYEEAFEYFGLTIVCGSNTLSEGEIALTTYGANCFVQLDYSYGGITKAIDKYEDLLGLQLFGHTIKAIVEPEKKDEYDEYFRLGQENYCGIKADDAIWVGCMLSVFTGEDIKRNGLLYVESNYFSDYSDNISILNQQGIFQPRNAIESTSTVKYRDGYSKDSRGALIEANYYSLNEWNQTSEEYINTRVSEEVERRAITDQDEIEKIYNKYYDELLINALRSYQTLDYTLTSTVDSKYSKKISEEIIGVVVNVSDDETAGVFYDTDLEPYVDEVAEKSNVKSLIYTAEFSSQSRKNLYSLLDATANYEKVRIGSSVVVDYIDTISIFKIFKIAFLATAIVFMLFSLVLIYKSVSDSLMSKYKEIGVLKAVGVSNFELFKIFIIQSLFYTVVTIASTILLQYVVIHYTNVLTSLVYNSNTYMESFFITYLNYLVVILLAFIVPILASLYPIIKCSRMNPKDVLNED